MDVSSEYIGARLCARRGVDIVTTSWAMPIANGTVVDFLTSELQCGADNDVGMVMALVRNSHGEVAMSVSTIPSASLTMSALEELGTRMCRAAGELVTVMARYET